MESQHKRRSFTRNVPQLQRHGGPTLFKPSEVKVYAQRGPVHVRECVGNRPVPKHATTSREIAAYFNPFCEALDLLNLNIHVKLSDCSKIFDERRTESREHAKCDGNAAVPTRLRRGDANTGLAAATPPQTHNSPLND